MEGVIGGKPWGVMGAACWWWIKWAVKTGVCAEGVDSFWFDNLCNASGNGAGGGGRIIGPGWCGWRHPDGGAFFSTVELLVLEADDGALDAELDVDELALSLAGLCLSGEESRETVSSVTRVEPRDKVIADISTTGGGWAAGNGGTRRC